jgi:hypothetical protein
MSHRLAVEKNQQSKEIQNAQSGAAESSRDNEEDCLFNFHRDEPQSTALTEIAV